MFLPPGFLLSMLIGFFWLIALVVLAVMWAIRVKSRRLARSRADDVWCDQCKYSLRGLSPPIENAVCPECGASLATEGAIRRADDSMHLSWRARIVVMSIVVLYPLLATSYNMHVFAAIQEWFIHTDSIQLSNPRSDCYSEVTIDAELTNLRIWKRGRVEVFLDGAAETSPTGKLTVLVPSMRATYKVDSNAVRRERIPLDSAFVVEWMQSQGMPNDAETLTKLTSEAEAIRLEIERMANAAPRTGESQAAAAAFRGWSLGMRTWAPWTPAWYWPVAIGLIAFVWLSLSRLVRPRTHRAVKSA